MATQQDTEAVLECQRIGKLNYILNVLREEIVMDLKDTDHILRQLKERDILSENEYEKVTSKKEGSAYSLREKLLDTLYIKQPADVDEFFKLLRETKQFRLVAKIEETNRDLEILLQNQSESVEQGQYQLPRKIVNSENRSDTLVTNDGIFPLYWRNAWDASPSKGIVNKLKHPLDYVIISHTANIGSYMTTSECLQACKQAQEINIGQGWSDIAYNFLVGNDGAIYEGRGWDIQASTAKGWNNKIIGIAFIGKYVDEMPSTKALDVTISFLQYMVDKGILKNDFTIHCLRQVRDLFPDAPGDMLYANIQTWHGKASNTWAWREVEELEEKDIEYAETDQPSKALKNVLKSQMDCLTKQITSTEQILNYLTQNNVLTNMKQKKILRKSKSDKEMMRLIIDHLLCGKKEWFPIFLEALLMSSQRILATSLWNLVPVEEKGLIKKPLLQVGDGPEFKDIPLEEIAFDKILDNDGKRMVELGAGSFGVVLLASYLKIGGAKVAVKRIRGSEHGGMNDKDLRDFKKEAKTMYRLRHPNIVTIYGTVCDKKEHVYGIVMEYMEVGSLDDLMTKIEIPWPIKVKMLRDVSRGLTFLNSPQPDRTYTVTHCDIKAKNILINESFSAKIADFGEAVLQIITSRSACSKSLASDRNHGIVTHMAPELLVPEDDKYDPNEKTDVWSFGITVFEICAENAKGTAERRTPFAKKMKQIQISTRIGVEKLSPFTVHEMEKIPKDCPGFLIELMKSCCRIERQHRPDFRGKK